MMNIVKSAKTATESYGCSDHDLPALMDYIAVKYGTEFGEVPEFREALSQGLDHVCSNKHGERYVNVAVGDYDCIVGAPMGFPGMHFMIRSAGPNYWSIDVHQIPESKTPMMYTKRMCNGDFNGFCEMLSDAVWIALHGRVSAEAAEKAYGWLHNSPRGTAFITEKTPVVASDEEGPVYSVERIDEAPTLTIGERIRANNKEYVGPSVHMSLHSIDVATKLPVIKFVIGEIIDASVREVLADAVNDPDYPPMSVEVDGE